MFEIINYWIFNYFPRSEEMLLTLEPNETVRH